MTIGFIIRGLPYLWTITHVDHAAIAQLTVSGEDQGRNEPRFTTHSRYVLHSRPLSWSFLELELWRDTYFGHNTEIHSRPPAILKQRCPLLNGEISVSDH